MIKTSTKILIAFVMILPHYSFGADPITAGIVTSSLIAGTSGGTVLFIELSNFLNSGYRNPNLTPYNYGLSPSMKKYLIQKEATEIVANEKRRIEHENSWAYVTLQKLKIGGTESFNILWSEIREKLTAFDYPYPSKFFRDMLTTDVQLIEEVIKFGDQRIIEDHVFFRRLLMNNFVLVNVGRTDIPFQLLLKFQDSPKIFDSLLNQTTQAILDLTIASPYRNKNMVGTYDSFPKDGAVVFGALEAFITYNGTQRELVEQSITNLMQNKQFRDFLIQTAYDSSYSIYHNQNARRAYGAWDMERGFPEREEEYHFKNVKLITLLLSYTENLDKNAQQFLKILEDRKPDTRSFTESYTVILAQLASAVRNGRSMPKVRFWEKLMPLLKNTENNSSQSSLCKRAFVR